MQDSRRISDAEGLVRRREKVHWVAAVAPRIERPRGLELEEHRAAEASRGRGGDTRIHRAHANATSQSIAKRRIRRHAIASMAAIAAWSFATSARSASSIAAGEIAAAGMSDFRFCSLT